MACLAGYGDKVDQGRMQPENAGAADYLATNFPKLDRIEALALVELSTVY